MDSRLGSEMELIDVEYAATKKYKMRKQKETMQWQNIPLGHAAGV